jgi:DNA-binding beta-propeller fold protein YncE
MVATLRIGLVAKLGILWLLTMITFGVVAYAIYYPQGGKPLMMLPIVEALGRGVAPHFLFNVYDVAEPAGIAVSKDGSVIYVAESSGQRQIVAFDRSGRQLFRTNAPESSPATRLPNYLTIGPDGNLYATDMLARSIQVFAPNGDYLSEIGAVFRDASWTPVGVAVDKDNMIYASVMGSAHQGIVKLDTEGTVVDFFGKVGELPGEMNYPNAMAVGDDGRLYVSSLVGGRIDVFSADGKYLGPEDKGFITSGLPKGVYIDAQARLYSVDTTNGIVGVHDLLVQPPKLLFSFGAGGPDGGLSFPTGIGGDGSGRIYVSDRTNNRVQVWSY